ncbi:N-acetylmuramoyl-L-alanine amidase-like domain-containing protein [Telluribacter sp.]|jgi:hypothetical protein|uniref:N-acetylmuramoyl-L-alanine amidase-like domain-containing protein n=1 Tax=Telluribacter sp. TaxID=1978767 RepID=UPI002E10D319|nr:N-acetylmuramoyl-L-alanine amidase-like domain-containing protein [Telluribacter sp.]
MYRPVLLLIVMLVGIGYTTAQDDDMQKMFRKRMEQPGGGTMPVLVQSMARTFLGTPYLAQTLEGNPKEMLVCRFDGLDCTTLVENAVALAVAKQKNLDYGGFQQELTQLRYRNGVIDGYTSRLHYFVDWLHENQKRGLLTDITAKLGGVPFSKDIHFMSSHPNLYPSLEAEAQWEKVKEIEKEINSRTYTYIPKYSIRQVEPLLQDGDIIGITSTVDGLDCNHQGIITKMGNRAYLLHASTTAQKVVLSPQPLAEYVASIKKHSGIIVARMSE